MVGIIVEEQLLPICSQQFGSSEKWKNAQSCALIASSYKDGRFTEGHKGVMSGISDFIRNIRHEEGNSTVDEFQLLREKGEILSLKWRSRRVLTAVFSDGTIAHITLKNLFTQEVVINIDKSLKHNDVISNVAYAQRIVLFLFQDNRLLIARTFEPPDEAVANQMVQPDVVIDTYPDFLPHLASRRVDKSMSINDRGDTFAIWWSASKDDVFPWSPKAEDRANVLIYYLHQNEVPSLMSFLKTDHRLLDAMFIPSHDQFCTLEQEIDSQGNISIVEIFYDIFNMSRVNETAIPIQSEITCFKYDYSKTRLALGCCDSSIVIYSQAGRITLFTKTPFIPIAVSWHPDSNLVFVAGERGRYQIFDIALSPMLLIQSGESTPSVTKQFLSCGPIKDMMWCPWPSASCDSNLLIHFESGPMVVLRCAMGRMDLNSLVNLYVGDGETSEAIKVLKSVYWNSDNCLTAMFNIYGSLIRQRHSDDIECALETLLAIYFVPTYGGDDHVRKKHGKSMRILARRFFMWLLPAGKFQRALQVATSLGEAGLFQKLHYVANAKGDRVTAETAMSLLTPLLSPSSGSSVSSSASTYDESCSSSGASSSRSETCSSCSSSEDMSSCDENGFTGPESEDEAHDNHVLVSEVSVPQPTTLRVLPLEVPAYSAAPPIISRFTSITNINQNNSSNNIRSEPEKVIATTETPPSSSPSTSTTMLPPAAIHLLSRQGQQPKKGKKPDIQVVHFGLV